MAHIKYSLNPPGKPPGLHVDIDLVQLMEIVHVATRRVSAFFKFALLSQERPYPDDFSLASGMTYRFWPEAIPDAAKEEAAQTFVSWVAGSCLKELDLHLSLFLDEVWLIAEIAEKQGSKIRTDHVFDPKFAKDTNTRAKLEKIEARIGAKIWGDAFGSLSIARNALTHSVGAVRQRDCNLDDGKLRVCWIATDVVVVDGHSEVLLTDLTYPYSIASPNGAEVLLKFVEREVVFALGEGIRFNEKQLGEICQFYMQQAHVIVQAVESYAQRTMGP